MHLRAISKILDYIFKRFIEGILNLPDITTEESEHLHKLLYSFFQFNSIFNSKKYSDTQPALSKKFHFIVNILDMNMATIMFHFDRGDLKDFGKDELDHLICALFADTPLRQKNLDHITSRLRE